MPHNARCACHTANSNPKLCATRNSKSRTSAGAVLGIRVVYLSRDIGLFVVLVARNRAVNLKKVNITRKARREPSSHHVLRMPIHDCVFQIETLEISNCSCFNLLWKLEEGRQLGYFCDVKLD
jgi:hypothetical protein